MQVSYKTKKLERSCCDERQMKRAYGQEVSRRLKRRLNALYAQPNMAAVRSADPQGRWHPLSGDLEGLWAGDLSRNWRIEVEQSVDGREVNVKVVEIEDYH